MEGRPCYQPPTGCTTAGKTMPIVVYSPDFDGCCAITGGYVYRGSANPALAGWYVFGDYCPGEIWAVTASASTPATPSCSSAPAPGHMISSFGEDDAGELYLCDLGGTVYRIDPA